MSNGNDNLVRIEVHKSLQDVLEAMRVQVCEEIKKAYKISDVTIYGSLVSQILASRIKNKPLELSIKKISPGRMIVR